MHVPLDVEGREELAGYERVDLFLEVKLHVLEHQVHLRGAHDHVLQLHDVFVLDFSQHRYFADGRARHALRLGLQLDLLKRDDLLGRQVDALVDHTVGAFAQRLDLLDLVDLPETELRRTSLFHWAYSLVLISNIIIIDIL